MLPAKINKSQIPHRPGVYQFFDAENKIIYVGKAIDLYKRVSSYFSVKHESMKTIELVSRIDHVETIIVESELEALILEANLIKKFLPRYNIRLTDDKDYLYIKITNDDFPKIVTARRKDLSKAMDYFGPFPSSTVVKSTLKKLRRVFPWCNNPPKLVGEEYKISKPCFYFHLKLCPGPCEGVVNKHDYRVGIRRFISFMQGNKPELVSTLTAEMQAAADNLEFERAAAIKNVLAGIGYVTSKTAISNYIEDHNYLENINQEALILLKQDLQLEKIPERIECYDISNISGQFATGSMVVLTNGDIDTGNYRRFKIKISGKPNDFAMHAEMMKRRLKHPEWGWPDLILIDGGRGQVRAAYKEISKAKLEFPIYGIAKRMEWLYPVEGEVIKIPRRSLSIRLIQKIRDESHRFAITYHRKLRAKAFLKSA